MANNVTTIQGYQASLGYVQIASIASATPLGVIPAYSDTALIQPTGGDMRYTDDGQTPTATYGMLVSDGAFLEYTGILKNLKFIAAVGTPTLNIIYSTKN